MEVHSHTHTERKKWTHYFWEFLMLFLAVFCGFLAENQREHMIEHNREKQYIKSLLGDLSADTTMIHAAIPRKEGRILSIASGRGVAGAPRSAHYAASKAGVIAFTKSLAVELAPDNITVNCVCPGATDTPMSRIGFTPDQFKKREEIPPLMDGLTHKFEIVGLVRYLLSDATKFVTGQTFFLRTPK